LPLGHAEATLLAVPAAALQRVRERWCVFVPKDERTFEIRPVGRGRDLGGEVEIVSGLHAGETIVVDGAFLLKAETERGAGEGEHEEHR
jgi:cobalt-zinc-cadmium efflux system membrane fusion protein